MLFAVSLLSRNTVAQEVYSFDPKSDTASFETWRDRAYGMMVNYVAPYFDSLYTDQGYYRSTSKEIINDAKKKIGPLKNQEMGLRAKLLMIDFLKMLKTGKLTADQLKQAKYGFLQDNKNLVIESDWWLDHQDLARADNYISTEKLSQQETADQVDAILKIVNDHLKKEPFSASVLSGDLQRGGFFAVVSEEPAIQKELDGVTSNPMLIEGQATVQSEQLKKDRAQAGFHRSAAMADVYASIASSKVHLGYQPTHQDSIVRRSFNFPVLPAQDSIGIVGFKYYSPDLMNPKDPDARDRDNYSATNILNQAFGQYEDYKTLQRRTPGMALSQNDQELVMIMRNQQGHLEAISARIFGEQQNGKD